MCLVKLQENKMKITEIKCFIFIQTTFTKVNVIVSLWTKTEGAANPEQISTPVLSIKRKKKWIVILNSVYVAAVAECKPGSAGHQSYAFSLCVYLLCLFVGGTAGQVSRAH